MCRAVRTQASKEYTWGRKQEVDAPNVDGEQEGSFQAEGEQEGSFQVEGEQEGIFQAESEQEGGVHAESEQAAGVATNTPRKVSRCEAAEEE